MTRPSLVDRPDQYQASVSGCLRGTMKTASSEPNFVSWPRPEETASRDREQPQDPDRGRSEQAGADIQARPCQKQRHNQACSTNHYDGFESPDFALRCSKPTREDPYDDSHLRPPKLGAEDGAGLARVVQPARSTCEGSHRTGGEPAAMFAGWVGKLSIAGGMSLAWSYGLKRSQR